MKINIFLDDIRIPQDAFNYTQNTVYLKETWIIARNYEEFVKVADTNKGNINIISFDHDLADEHYVDKDMFSPNPEDYNKHYQNFKEKTGLECAKYLADNDIPFEGFFVHSQNPVGKTNIKSFLNNWLDFKVRNS